MLLVIDSSVVAKWLFLELLTDKALAVRRDWERSQVDLIAPELMLLEVSNIIWKKQRSNLITEEEGNSILTSLLALEIPLVEQETFLPRAYSLAKLFDRTIYDALYLAIAESMGAKLITADLRLYNSVSLNLGFVQYLGSYQSLTEEM